MSESTCSIDGCSRPRMARGWCSSHYTRWHRTGDPTTRIKGEVRNGCRVCPVCREDKPLNCYSPAQSWCKPCFAARKRRGYRPVMLPLALIFCVECGDRFSPDKRTTVCCSAKCSLQRKLRFDRQDTLTYRALKADAWVESVVAETVYERDAWICQLCHEDINPLAAWPSPWSASVDHVLPLALGGIHSYSNVQAAHLHCNTSKQARVS